MQKIDLNGKTILVTGASSGIGAQTAIDCSKMGGNKGLDDYQYR